VSDLFKSCQAARFVSSGNRSVALLFPEPYLYRHPAGPLNSRRCPAKAGLYKPTRQASSRIFKVKLMILNILLAESLRRKINGLLNLKNLLTTFPASVEGPFPGFVGRLKRAATDLLIPQWLLFSLRRRRD